MKKFLIIIGIFFLIVFVTLTFINPFRSPSTNKTADVFTLAESGTDVAGLKLQEAGYIRSLVFFDIALYLKGKGNQEIKGGGYYLSRNMDTWNIIDKLYKGPDLVWITVLPGNRKEQIGEKLKDALGWSDDELSKWNDTYTAMKIDYIEGVYFPDTYLIPVRENGLQIADRMIDHFNDQLASYLDQFAAKNIRWTTGLKIASIIQRESAGTDMKLISGIIWNRLLKNQRLQLDATVQYAKGKTNGNWWPPVYPSDIREIDSPYNTYKHLGLPPTPISEPSLAAIEAALNPEETDCFYYLHDRSRQIHCSITYEEHLQNIKTYLNN